MNSISLGILLGLLLGLSKSPVLATSITAVGSIIAATVGIYLESRKTPKLRADKSEPGNPPPPDPAQPQIITGSMSTGTKWIPPFAFAMILGLTLGIVVRANDLLDFRSKNLPDNLRAQGFTQSQTEIIMNRLASSSKLAELAPPAGDGSSLLGKPGTMTAADHRRNYPDPKKRLENYLELTDGEPHRILKAISETVSNSNEAVEVAEVYLFPPTN